MVPQHTRLTVAITTLDMGVAKCTCIHKASQSKCLANNRSLWNHNEYERGPDPRTPLLLRHYVNTGPAYEKEEGSIVFYCGCTECESARFSVLGSLGPSAFWRGDRDQSSPVRDLSNTYTPVLSLQRCRSLWLQFKREPDSITPGGCEEYSTSVCEGDFSDILCTVNVL